MADLARAPALAGTPVFDQGGLRFREAPRSGLFLLSGRLDQAAIDLIGARIGQPLAQSPGRLMGAGPRSVLLAPCRWLILAPDGSSDALRVAVAGTPATIWEITDGRAQLALSGALVPALLATACSIDLREPAFAPGAVAQTQFGRVAMLLIRESAETWRLIADVSVAGYVWSLLTTNAELLLALDERAD